MKGQKRAAFFKAMLESFADLCLEDYSLEIPLPYAERQLRVQAHTSELLE